MNKLTLTICIVFCSQNLWAEEAKRSIMDEPTEIEQTINTDNNMEEDKCAMLRQKIEDLKGKPQRKHAAIQEYNLECTDTPSSE